MTTHSYETELEAKWTFEGDIEPFVKGVYSGPPENCYPDEGGYATLVSGSVGNHVFNHVELAAIFSEEDIQAIESDIYEAWLENQQPEREYEPDFD